MKNHKCPSYPAANTAHSHQNSNCPTLSNSNSQLDAHGHDQDDYVWIPVPRKRRHDGWTPEKQREFIETLADTGSVVGAARSVGLSKQSAYALSRSKGAEGFAAAWDAAIGQSSRLLADVAFDRAINGTEQHVIDKEGRHIYRHMKTNDRLLMFLLRAHQPEIYGRGCERTMSVPAQGQPVAEAIDKLLPVQPDQVEEFWQRWKTPKTWTRRECPKMSNQAVTQQKGIAEFSHSLVASWSTLGQPQKEKTIVSRPSFSIAD